LDDGIAPYLTIRKSNGAQSQFDIRSLLGTFWRQAMLANDSDAGPGAAMRANAWLYLDEITHRTLNDYTAMLAIVRRAASMAGDDMSGRALADVAARLRAAATTLRALRPPREGHVRDLEQELVTFCGAITNSILAAQAITLTLSAEPVIVSAQRCWQVTLVISELITNAARHAFQGANQGSIAVSVRSSDGTIQCTIADDGACRGAAIPGRGTAIVDALIGDLGGTITRRFSNAGSAVAFSVPLAETRYPSSLSAQPEMRTLFGSSQFNFSRFRSSTDERG
jgi:two-component sensor histidine kinase